MTTFSLAPMDTLFRVLTWLLMLLPLGFLWFGEMRLVGVFITLVYAHVYFFWRPARFQAAPGRAVVNFPVRSRRFDDVVGAEQVSLAQVYGRFGGLVRVGAGGLWGGFGWLWRPGLWLEFYISRRDGLVLLHRADGSMVLVSPADPAGFVSAVGRSAAPERG